MGSHEMHLSMTYRVTLQVHTHTLTYHLPTEMTPIDRQPPNQLWRGSKSMSTELLSLFLTNKINHLSPSTNPTAREWLYFSLHLSKIFQSAYSLAFMPKLILFCTKMHVQCSRTSIHVKYLNLSLIPVGVLVSVT